MFTRRRPYARSGSRQDPTGISSWASYIQINLYKQEIDELPQRPIPLDARCARATAHSIYGISHIDGSKRHFAICSLSLWTHICLLQEYITGWHITLFQHLTVCRGYSLSLNPRSLDMLHLRLRHPDWLSAPSCRSSSLPFLAALPCLSLVTCDFPGSILRLSLSYNTEVIYPVQIQNYLVTQQITTNTKPYHLSQTTPFHSPPSYHTLLST